MTTPKYQTLPITEVMTMLSTSQEAGLSSRTVEELRKAEGSNISGTPFTLFAPLAVVVYLAPLCILASMLYRHGDLAASIVVLTAALLLSVGIYGLIHRVVRVEAKRAQLRHAMNRAEVTVVRDGMTKDVFAKHLVPGDILVYDRKSDFVLPADVRLLPGHTMVLSHSWYESHRSGTHVPPEHDFLPAGTEVSFASASMVVIATGHQRKLFTMYKAHPAGPLVQAVWSMGWWYLAGTLLLLAISTYFGSTTTVAYALAAGTPVLLPYFLMKKGRGLRMQQTHDVPDHLLYPAEELLMPEAKESLTLLGEELASIRSMKKAPEAMQARTAQFLELLDLCVRDTEATRHGALIHKIVMGSKRYGLLMNTMEEWTHDTELSRTTFHEDTGTYVFRSSFVQRGNDEEHTLHLLSMDAATILEQSTYMWDEREHTMRRRFFNGEKQRLAAMIATYEKDAALCYGLALREHGHEDAPLLFIGALIIPRTIHEETLNELVAYAKNGHAVVLYSEGNLSPEFLRDRIHVPSNHIYASAEELSFTGLRRNDLFFVGRVNALSLRDLHDRLHGGVLVDTHEDHFISNLFFWPTYIRFSKSHPSFFHWLRHHTKQARDGMTKSAQYAAMQLTISLGLLALFLLKETPMDVAMYLSFFFSTILGVTALFGHFTDTNIHHKKIHTLSLTNIHQAILTTRFVFALFLSVGGYLLLSKSLGALSLEMVFFGLLAICAAMLAKIAEDTRSLRHTLVYAGIYGICSVWGYLGLFFPITHLDTEYMWLFLGALLLGGITWILASYQTVPESRTEA